MVIAGVVIIGALMSILDATVVNVALDTLSRDLQAPLPTIQWIMAGAATGSTGPAPALPGLAAFIYGVSETRSLADLGSATVVISVGAAVVLIAAFVARSLRQGDQSLLDVRLFGDRTFAAASVTTFALGTATFGSTLLLPLY